MQVSDFPNSGTSSMQISSSQPYFRGTLESLRELLLKPVGKMAPYISGQ